MTEDLIGTRPIDRLSIAADRTMAFCVYPVAYRDDPAARQPVPRT